MPWSTIVSVTASFGIEKLPSLTQPVPAKTVLPSPSFT